MVCQSINRDQMKGSECYYGSSNLSSSSSNDSAQEESILNLLLEVFPELSVESIASAYTTADGDANLAAELLTKDPRRSERKFEQDPRDFNSRKAVPQGSWAPDGPCITKVPSGYGLAKGSPWSLKPQVSPYETPSPVPGSVPLASSGDKLKDKMQKPFNVGISKKKPMRSIFDDSLLQPKDAAQHRAVEEFLYSMLGDTFELGIAVIRDVLVHFAGDIHKSLESLLHMASSSPGINNICDSEAEMGAKLDEDSKHPDPLVALDEAFPDTDSTEVICTFQDCERDVEQSKVILSHNPNSTETSNSHTSEKDSVLLEKLQEAFPSVELDTLYQVLQASHFVLGDAVRVLGEAGLHSTPKQIQKKLDPKEVLEALFTVKKDVNNESPILERSKFKSVIRKEVAAEVKTNPQQAALNGYVMEKNFKSYGEWNDYDRHRLSADEHWRTMKNYFQQAAGAHMMGDRALAGILSEKGKQYKKLAQEARDRASKNLFYFKNQDTDNQITIDLHEQHVTKAIDLLRTHLKNVSPIASIDVLNVITGHGSHSSGGRARIKPAVVKYLEKKAILWTEVNQGCICIKMSDVRKKCGLSEPSGNSQITRTVENEE